MNKIIYGLNQNPIGGIIADERYAKVVYSIFEMYLEGKSLGGISKELKARNILSPTGKETWSRPTIENVLSNILYVGTIIPAEIFLKVEEQRNMRSNKQLNNDGEEVRKSTRYNSCNVLSGLLICEECGSNYRRITKPSVRLFGDAQVEWIMAKNIATIQRLLPKRKSKRLSAIF